MSTESGKVTKKTAKKKDKTVAARTARYEANQKNSGLTRVHLWVPKDKRQEIIDIAEKLRGVD